ncbi:MAG: hypothetical protein LBM01_02585 [Christensenellaceae bacterium]|jgi:archaellum component FlaC|nr:hypothetical protein [Christensenellaceae bacterium]
MPKTTATSSELDTARNYLINSQGYQNFSNALADCKSKIEQIISDGRTNETQKIKCTRLKYILEQVDSVIRLNGSPFFITDKTISDLHTALTAVASGLAQFMSYNMSDAYWNSISTQEQSILDKTANIMSLTNAHHTRGNYSQISTSLDSVTAAAKGYTDTIAGYKNEIASLQKQITESKNTLEKLQIDIKEDAANRFGEQISEFNKISNDYQAEFNFQKEQANEILSTLGLNADTSNYQNAAKEFDKKAKRAYIWTYICFGVVVILPITFYVFMFLTQVSLEHWWQYLIPMVSTMPLWILVAYLSRQAHKQFYLAMANRKTALELATLKPWLNSIDDDNADDVTRNDILKSYAQKLFIDSKLWVELKDDKGVRNPIQITAEMVADALTIIINKQKSK